MTVRHEGIWSFKLWPFYSKKISSSCRKFAVMEFIRATYPFTVLVHSTAQPFFEIRQNSMEQITLR